MSGPSAASSLSSCWDSPFSRARAALTNLLRLLRFLERHRASRSKQWTQNTKSTASLKLDRCRGKRYLDIERREKPSTLCRGYSNMIQRRGQRHYPLYLIHTSTNWGSRVLGCRTAAHCPISSTSLKMSIIWNKKLFRSAFPRGTLDLSMVRRRERARASSDSIMAKRSISNERSKFV